MLNESYFLCVASLLLVKLMIFFSPLSKDMHKIVCSLQKNTYITYSCTVTIFSIIFMLNIYTIQLFSITIINWNLLFHFFATPKLFVTVIQLNIIQCTILGHCFYFGICQTAVLNYEKYVTQTRTTLSISIY
jgi:hypothetical protein